MSDEEIKKKVEKFQKQLKETALGINYIQPKFKKRFLEIAKEEYNNDYGVTLKELIKLYDGYFPKGTEEIEAKVDILADEMNKLKEKVDSLTEKDVTPEGYVRSADGSRLIKKLNR